MQIDNEYIDKCLKVFYRFSKESKQFMLLKNYLFFPAERGRNSMTLLGVCMTKVYMILAIFCI